MKYVVTGASGFIGSYLCDYLRRAGHTVVPVIRKGSEALIDRWAVGEYICSDVLSPAWTERKVEADAVVHLASGNDVLSKDARKGIELAVFGTQNVLDFAVNNRIGKVLFFSTFQVYGTDVEGMIDESVPPAPNNFYGLNKLYAEQCVRLYARTHRLQAAIVRPVNVYGRISSPTVRRWTLVPFCFCKEAFEKRTITLMSSGKQIRNFISLENTARAAECVLQRFPRQLEVVHFGSSTMLSILHAAKIVAQVYERLYAEKVDIRINGVEPEKPNWFAVSMEKLKQYGFVEDRRFTLETESEAIFKHLENMKEDR